MNVYPVLKNLENFMEKNKFKIFNGSKNLLAKEIVSKSIEIMKNEKWK